MNTRNKLIAAVILGSSITGASLLAKAGSSETNDALAAAGAPVTMNQAIAIAIGAVPGTETKAEFENEGGKIIWEVEVLGADHKVYDFKIDAASGKILKQKLDKPDHEHDDDDDDDKEDKG